MSHYFAALPISLDKYRMLSATNFSSAAEVLMASAFGRRQITLSLGFVTLPAASSPNPNKGGVGT